MTMHPSPPRSTAAPRARREGAFGMVEIIVVTLIILVLGGAVVMGLRGSKQAARTGEAMSAAAAYDEAIAKHMSDNGNFPPAAADMLNLQGKWAGPRSLADPQRPYLGSLPSGVAEGRIGVSPTCAAPTGSAELAWISYCAEAAPNYGIRLTTRSPDEAWSAGDVCWRGNTTRTPRCR